MSKSIETRKGQTIIVDEVDYAELSRHTWSISSSGYARRTRWIPGGGYECIYMHRVLIGLLPNDGMEADHRNGNKLDNSRGNLRVCCSSQNKMNSKARPGTASGHKGITRGKRGIGWQARITSFGRTVNLGNFKNLSDAVEFRDLVAEFVHGEFACASTR